MNKTLKISGGTLKRKKQPMASNTQLTWIQRNQITFIYHYYYCFFRTNQPLIFMERNLYNTYKNK